MLHCSQTPVKDALRRGGRRGEVEKGVTGLCSCFASLLGDAVCWLGLQRERAEQRRGEGRRGEERGGEGRQDGGRGESALPDSSACRCCCIDEKKLQSGDVRATRKKER